MCNNIDYAFRQFDSFPFNSARLVAGIFLLLLFMILCSPFVGKLSGTFGSGLSELYLV